MRDFFFREGEDKIGAQKTAETITKVARQYSQPLPQETLAFLRGIAEDYSKVKNYVYSRYSGVRNMNRLVPAYDVLTEMRHCGLRAELDLPSSYYEVAVAEAISDIRGMWGMLKNRLRDLIGSNENLTADDRTYLRTVLKIGSVFSAVLNRVAYEKPRMAAGLQVDERRLNSLLCRLVRKYLKAPLASSGMGFKVAPSGYKYKGAALYLVSRVARKRICIPLKDSNMSKRQLHIRLQGNQAVITMPVEVEVKRNLEARNILYAHIGYKDMVTLSTGRVYGRDLNKLVTPETERLAGKNKERGRQLEAYRKCQQEGNQKKAESIRQNNLGKSKYARIKRREREKTKNYINAELNRLVREEHPKKIVITRLVMKNRGKTFSPALNRRLARSFGSFVRERLAYKCQLHGIELEQISSKGTASICSACGAEGKREQYDFICEACGYQIPAALNSARNIEKACQGKE